MKEKKYFKKYNVRKRKLRRQKYCKTCNVFNKKNYNKRLKSKRHQRKILFSVLPREYPERKEYVEVELLTFID